MLMLSARRPTPSRRQMSAETPQASRAFVKRAKKSRRFRSGRTDAGPPAAAADVKADAEAPETVSHGMPAVPPTCLTDLPAEILTAIVSFVDSHTIMFTVAPSCKTLYAVATDPYLWSCCVVTACCRTEMIHLARRYPGITALDASAFRIEDDDTIGSLLTLQNLQYFASNGVEGDMWEEGRYQPLRRIEGADLVSHIFAAGAHLQDLTLTSTIPAVTNEFAVECPNLTRLSCVTLAIDSTDFPNLVELKTKGWEPSVKFWNEFVESHTQLQSFTTTKKLKIGSKWPTLPDAGLAYPTSLTAFSTVNEDVETNNFLFGIIRNNPYLTALKIPQLNESVVDELQQHLATKLKKLEFGAAWLKNGGTLCEIAELEELICKPYCPIAPAVVLPTVLKCGQNLDSVVTAVGVEGLWNLRELHISTRLGKATLAGIGRGATHLKSLVVSIAQVDYNSLAPACTGLIQLLWCVKKPSARSPSPSVSAVVAAAAPSVQRLDVRRGGGSAFLVEFLAAAAPRPLQYLGGGGLETEIVPALEAYAQAGGRIVELDVGWGGYYVEGVRTRSVAEPTEYPELVSLIQPHGWCPAFEPETRPVKSRYGDYYFLETYEF